jgi:hypothetical protein
MQTDESFEKRLVEADEEGGGGAAAVAAEDTGLNAKLEEFYSENVVKVADNKFKCHQCSKMFRGADFVKKHIETKHEDHLDAIQERAHSIRFYDNYMADTDR